MLVLMIVVLVAIGFGVTVAGIAAGRRQLHPPPAPGGYERQLAEQAERIDALETELRLLKEQADFTEKLLTERSGERGAADGLLEKGRD